MIPNSLGSATLICTLICFIHLVVHICYTFILSTPHFG